MDLKLEIVRVAQTDVTKLAAVSLWLSYIDTNITRLSAHMHRLLRSGPILQEVVHMGPCEQPPVELDLILIICACGHLAWLCWCQCRRATG